MTQGPLVLRFLLRMRGLAVVCLAEPGGGILTKSDIYVMQTSIDACKCSKDKWAHDLQHERMSYAVQFRTLIRRTGDSPAMKSTGVPVQKSAVVTLRGTKGVPRKGVWTSVSTRVWTPKEWRAKHGQTSCCLQTPHSSGPPQLPPESRLRALAPGCAPLYIYIYIYIYHNAVCIHVYIYIYRYTYICIYVHISVCINMCFIYIYIYIDR